MTNQEIYTENLGDFCSRERHILIEILQAWERNGLPPTFEEENVRPAFNRNSGCVFLVNDEYQTVMLSNGLLYVHHSTPYAGIEGFLEDIMAENAPEDLNSEDVEYVRVQAEAEGLTLPKNWQEE